MTEFYESTSKGRVRIATMEYKWLVNSLNILVTRQPHRTDEIEAMTAEVAKRDAEYAAQQAAELTKPDYAPGDEVEVFEDNAPENFAADHEVFE